MRPILPALAAALAFGAADAARGDSTAPTLEIVTFRLIDGVDKAAFLDAAKSTAPFLDETGAVLSRALTVDSDGLWTDVVHWTSLGAAEAAATELMTRPEAAAFLAAIDPASITLRHAAILWQME
ncbi:MAG: hypothetical protein QNJ13_05185 [Paracoccaceae bacterium]|nr:hypothetical protein [Paracoccaceae bacterium]